MRRSIGACVLAAAVLLAIVPASAGERKVPARTRGSSGQDRSTSLLSAPALWDYVPEEILVTFEPQVARATQSVAVARSVAGAELDSKVTPAVAVVEVPSGTNVPAAAERLRRDPTVAWAEPNWYRQPLVIPNDPALQWSLAGATGVSSAWDIETGSPSTVIAIIDTGAQAAHPDLNDNLWTNTEETPGNNVDDDGNGHKDDVYGWDFVGNKATPSDVDGHGTHVAGIAAAEWNNNEGGSGVCPECSLMILKAGTGADGFKSSDVVAAIRYAADNGADVINLSIGGPQWGKAERNALKYAIGKGSLIVAAAGNEDRNNDTIDYSTVPIFGVPFGPSYPASYDLPGLISVAASTPGDGYASFSNVGRYSVDLAAPGVDIVSTVPTSAYLEMSGTSMSSPFVAGLAGLLRSANTSMTPVQMKNAILNGIDEPGLKSGRSLTNGRVNALAALDDPDLSNATPKHDGVMSGAVSIAYKKSGTVSVPADHNDIYKKRLRKGKVYAALLKVPPSRDFDLFVWKPGSQDTFPSDYGCGGFSCFLRAVSARGKGVDEYVRFKATKSGVYYFLVNAFKGSGKYTLLVGVPG
ncbi:MAG TPA: S8 family peptidase [Actinomycetota bacterium]|nr:S8 family peptidase [Actinomycetota bacterium]